MKSRRINRSAGNESRTIPDLPNKSSEDVLPSDCYFVKCSTSEEKEDSDSGQPSPAILIASMLRSFSKDEDKPKKNVSRKLTYAKLTILQVSCNVGGVVYTGLQLASLN